MIKAAEYAKRRKAIMDQVGQDSVVILTASHTQFRNHYHEYSFRQNSDFYYLTGFQEPEAVLVLLPKRKNGEFILFNRVRDRSEEIWTGYRAGQTGACEIYGADESFPIDEFPRRLSELLEGRENIYYSLGLDPLYDQMIVTSVNHLIGKVRTGITAPSSYLDIRPLLHEMRLFKSPAEIDLMRKAATITAEAHIQAMQVCKPGMYEYQLEAELSYHFQYNGARFMAYTPIIGSGPNTCILHYVENNRQIQNGDMVLIDAGCEYDYYASDVTRTFPANGKFSAEQRAIYEIVLKAQLAGIKATRPGAQWSTIENTAAKIITEGLVDVGLLKGNVDSLVEQKAYTPFYMHRVGHFIGLDTHDAGVYKVDNKWRKIEAGMVRTIEPGIYISADIPGVHKRWHNIGVRIEDDVLVTEKGNEVLSQALPKTLSDIEKIMSR
jgi:Xaa-Pro aminopeptidase